MKKLLLAALLLPLAVFTHAADKPRAITLGLVAKSQGNPVFQAARVGAQDAAKELGAIYNLAIKIDWRTPNEEDAQKQAEAIEQLVLNGAEGIAVACSDANKLTDAINAAVSSATGLPLPPLSGAGSTRSFNELNSEVVGGGR
jgi:ribose transport system substrate-binding protein